MLRYPEVVRKGQGCGCSPCTSPNAVSVLGTWAGERGRCSRSEGRWALPGWSLVEYGTLSLSHTFPTMASAVVPRQRCLASCATWGKLGKLVLSRLRHSIKCQGVRLEHLT